MKFSGGRTVQKNMTRLRIASDGATFHFAAAAGYEHLTGDALSFNKFL